MRSIFICRNLQAVFLVSRLRECRVDGSQHFFEQGRGELSFFAVDGEESEILDDAAQGVLVRPEGEGECLIVEFEHTIFFGAQALEDGQIDAISCPAHACTEFGRPLFGIVVDEKRHILVVGICLFHDGVDLGKGWDYGPKGAVFSQSCEIAALLHRKVTTLSQ